MQRVSNFSRQTMGHASKAQYSI